MLVLFTDDGRRGAALPTNPFSGERPLASVLKYNPLSVNSKMEVACFQLWDVVLMYVFSMGHRGKDRRFSCQIHPLLVDFEEIGWSGWIISPRGYNAFHCKGSCPFPLGENMRPTNHATVQSIINALKLSQDVSGPCCVPDKLFSINLLYFDDDENVVLRQYDDMVAGSCGCH